MATAPAPASAFVWRAARMLSGLWWGGTTALAFVAVPMLFASLGSPALAGPVAAKLFTVVCVATVVIATLLLVFLMKFRHSALVQSEQFAIYLLILALVAALVQQGWVAGQIVGARASGGNLALWHGLGSALVLLQWACAVTVAWWFSRPEPATAVQHPQHPPTPR